MGIPMPEAIIRKPKPSKDMKKLATLLLLFLYGMSEALAQTGYWTDEGNYDISWYSFAQREYANHARPRECRMKAESRFP